jgi:hypothetical protein
VASQPIPTFLYIGTVKAGSSWLFEALREHPQVFVPEAKDLKYFDVHYEQRSFDQYLKYFSKAGDAIAIGELSHDYFTRPEYARRIQRHLPDVKLIVCLREPGDLAVSAYKYIRLLKKEADVGFEAFVDGYLATSRYAEYLNNLRPFFELFARQNIHIAFFDELRADAGAFIRSIYRFIGVDQDFAPSLLDRKVNPTGHPRFGAAPTQIVYWLVQLFRRLGFENAIGTLKANPLITSLFFSGEPQSDEVIDEATVARVRSRCAKTYDALEALIGKPLPNSWPRDGR